MEIRIYVANLAAYNEGRLVGDWLTLPMDEEELTEAIKKILGKDEEWAIHDYEAPFSIHEYDSPYELNKLLEDLEDIDEEEDVIRAIADIVDKDELFQILKDQSYSFIRDVHDEQDLALKIDQEYFPFDFEAVDKAGASGYLDYEAIGHDLCLNGWNICGGGLAVMIDQ